MGQKKPIKKKFAIDSLVGGKQKTVINYCYTAVNSVNTGTKKSFQEATLDLDTVPFKIAKISLLHFAVELFEKI